MNKILKNFFAKDGHETFGTVINCMDGRVQEGVSKYLKKNFALDYVDTITEAGPVKILAENNDEVQINSIIKKIKISVEKHNSRLIAIVAHHDCAGNPVPDKQQLEQLTEAILNMERLIKQFELEADCVGLWVGENMQVSTQFATQVYGKSEEEKTTMFEKAFRILPVFMQDFIKYWTTPRNDDNKMQEELCKKIEQDMIEKFELYSSLFFECLHGDSTPEKVETANRALDEHYELARKLARIPGSCAKEIQTSENYSYALESAFKRASKRAEVIDNSKN